MLHSLFSLAQQAGTPVALLLAVCARVTVLSSAKGSEPRARFRFAFSIFLVHALLLVATWCMTVLGAPHSDGARIGAMLTGTLANVTLGSLVLFEGVLRRVRPGLPGIVPDIVTTVAAFIALMRTSSQLGFEVSGVIATSAVLTAVVGLALQDTLGNAVGGLALQLDRSVKVGDWIRLDQISGRVAEIHWRYTAVETSDWETVIVPNSVLMRSQVTVLGRRQGQPLQWRRWVNFQVDFRNSPSDVIQVIDRALLVQAIPGVASQPAPHCLAVDFADSQTRYAVRYWLTDMSSETATDSLVRNRIFYALARARIGLAIPAQTLFVTADDQARHAQKRELEHGRRVAALRRIDLFADLVEADLNELASRLEPAPFAKGETITREGAVAHHLYIILAGSVSVRVGGIEDRREVNRLVAGEFFGEMALLTGERRSASCIALDEVQCYRLDAEAFRSLLARHPELAQRVAQVLAERETGLIAAKERLGSEQREKLRAQKERVLVTKIRAFFELD
ncbi:MAG: Potassium efflux system KefA protein [Myxococcaceae bacterium]|nr:Potassium efflux system KefA protein [Myxococcaceae bacterium]